MRGEAMAQSMRADPRKARIGRGPSFERLEKSLPGHRAAQPRDENRRDATRNFLLSPLAVISWIQNLVAAVEIGLQGANRRTAHRHHPLLAALAEHNDGAGGKVHLIDLQTDQLRN